MRTSNVLLIYAIAFATLSAIYGIASWTEHPDLITRHEWLSALQSGFLNKFDEYKPYQTPMPTGFSIVHSAEEPANQQDY